MLNRINREWLQKSEDSNRNNENNNKKKQSVNTFLAIHPDAFSDNISFFNELIDSFDLGNLAVKSFNLLSKFF